MQIAFWSDNPWQSGLVGNLVGIAYITAAEYAYQSLIIQTRFACPDLDFALIPAFERDRIREDYSYYYQSGLDAVLNEAALQIEDKERFRTHVIEIIKDKLFYLPGTNKNNQEIYEHSLYTNLSYIMKIIHSFCDITFMDVRDTETITAKQIIERSDIFVVNVCQNPISLLRLSSIDAGLQEKTVFLVGQYDAESKYHIRNIRRKFQISKDNIHAIPYNVRFQDALSEGHAVQFLEQNLECRKTDFNYPFMHELKAATDFILAKAAEKREK